jgi:rare lipoprotein A
MLKISKLLWVVLLACAFLALGADRAEARGGLASWYGPQVKGLPTASGETFDPQGYTAAHKTLPFGTDLLVSYRGRSVAVTVNDRGPYVGGRELDLSRAAAKDIGLTRAGVDYVEYTRTDRSYGGGGYGGGGYGGGGYGAGYSTGPGYSTHSPPQSYAAPDQSEAAGGAYVVQSGDTLYEIALQTGTTVEYLAAANGIADPDVIYAGQTLYY